MIVCLCETELISSSPRLPEKSSSAVKYRIDLTLFNFDSLKVVSLKVRVIYSGFRCDLLQFEYKGQINIRISYTLIRSFNAEIARR